MNRDVIDILDKMIALQERRKAEALDIIERATDTVKWADRDIAKLLKEKALAEAPR